MNKILIVVLVVLTILVAIYIAIVFSRPKKEDFIYLMQPRLTTKEKVLSLVVNFNGDADKVIKEAYGKLFKRYFSIKQTIKGRNQPAPIARYEGFDKILGLTQDNIKSIPWKGFVAIPIPPELNEKNKDDVEVRFVDYGLVAEIVHFGAYDKEKDNIDKLKEFIRSSGYEIIGPHEEEYILGPGFFYVPPKNYITIIRYQIKKIK